VQKQDGAWDVTLSIAPHDELNSSRGTGSTFSDAWNKWFNYGLDLFLHGANVK
jgi:hypothetical protein